MNTELYIVLEALSLLCLAYMVLDSDNPHYLQIISGIVCTIFSFIVALSSVSGVTIKITPLLGQTIENITTGNTSYSYAMVNYTFQDATLMWIWILIGITGILYTVLMIFKLIIDSSRSSEE